MSIFVANLVISLIALGSLSLIVFCKLSFFSKFTHASWCALGALSCLTWVIACILFPEAVVIMETCGALDQAQSDPQLFLKAGALFAPQEPNGVNAMYQCMFNDTKPLHEKGLSTLLGNFDLIYNVSQNNTEFYSMNPNISIVSSVVIPNQEAYLSNIRVGRLADSTQTVTDLATLNSWTNLSLNGCTPNGTKDYWVFNNLNCTVGYSMQINDEDYTSFPNLTCIGFNIWMSNGNLIDNRYNSSIFPGSCVSLNGTQYYNYLRIFVNNYISNRNKIATNHGQLLNSLANVSNYNSIFMRQVAALGNFTQVNLTLTNITDLLYGQGGLLTNNDCSYLNESFANLTLLMCESLVGPVYQTAIAVVITAFFTMFGSLFLFCLSKMLSVRVEGEYDGPKRRKHVQMRDLKPLKEETDY
jgi:hypothetical protein